MDPDTPINETGEPPSAKDTPAVSPGYRRVPSARITTQKKRKDTGLLRQTRTAKQVNILDAVRLRIQNKLTWAEVSARTGICKGTLQAQLAKLYDLLDVDRRDAYELARPQILSGVEERLLIDMLDPGRRQNATLNNTAYAFTQVHQARRLEAGQTTSNVGILAAIIGSDDTNAT